MLSPIALLLLFLLPIWTPTVLSFPSNPLRPRNAIQSTTIDANITSHTGTDLSSAFQILIYNPPPPAAAPSGLSDRGLPYTISTCQSTQGTFVRSHCVRDPAARGYSMQAYVTFCRGPARNGAAAGPMLVERGTCEVDQLCVDGPNVPGAAAEDMAARCVNKNEFVEAAALEQAGVVFGGKRVSAVVSERDGRTPVEVASLEVDAGGGAETGTGQGGEMVTEGGCVDCFEVRTQALPFATDRIRSKVELVATAAAAGAIWFFVNAG